MSKARETVANGWRWSRRNGGGLLYPHGYCGAYVAPNFLEENARAAFSAKYHNSDHANANQCKTCYREFQLDQILNLDTDIGWSTTCYVENCTGQTDKGASIEGYMLPLCDNHRTLSQVDALYTGPWETDD